MENNQMVSVYNVPIQFQYRPISIIKELMQIYQIKNNKGQVYQIIFLIFEKENAWGVSSFMKETENIPAT